MNTTPIKLAGEERTSIVNALTVAARQYEIVLHRGDGMVRMLQSEQFMRADLALGLLITLLSASIAIAQVSIDVSKVTCDQFANGKVGPPRTTAIWLNGYYHGKMGSTTIDTQQAEDNFGQLMNFCQTGENGKVLVMKAIEHMLKSK